MEPAKLSVRLFNEAEMEKYIRDYCKEKGMDQTSRALDFALDKHKKQFRKSRPGQERVPYINHPLLIACHAIALGLEEDDLLSACLLHDVCEDCGVAVDALPVNESTKKVVGLLTKPADFQKTARDEKAYYDAIANSRTAAMVKLLDRCNNVSMMAVSFSDAKMEEYIRETRNYLYPLLEKAQARYPEYARQLFLIRYHMTSVVESLLHRLYAARPQQ